MRKKTRKHTPAIIPTSLPSSLPATYSQEDYSSNDGMLTTVWGPGMWHFMHTMSFNYPVCPTSQQKNDYRDFIYSLRDVLPCGKCRKNLSQTLKTFPLKIRPHMDSRAAFSKYIYDLHEKVNHMLKKKSGLSYEEVRERYEHFRARCIKKSSKKTTMRKRKEVGCVVPLYGEKSKCILKIVPQDFKCDTMQIDEKCVKKRLF
jgi:hypothetical protein